MKNKNWIWIIIIILLVFSVQKKEISHEGMVVLYTDTHVREPGSDPATRFETFVNWSNSRGFIHGFSLGDNIDDGNKPEQYTEYFRIDNMITYPHDILVGNHDSNAPQEWLAEDMVLEVISNTCFAKFNTYSTLQLHGEWTTAQVNWLDSVMTSAIGECDYFVVLSHHSIFTARLDRSSINGDAAKAVLDSHLSDYTKITNYRGHDHDFKVDRDNGIEYITGPNVGNMGGSYNPMAIVYDPATGYDELCFLELHADGQTGGCRVIDDTCTDKHSCATLSTSESDIPYEIGCWGDSISVSGSDNYCIRTAQNSGGLITFGWSWGIPGRTSKEFVTAPCGPGGYYDSGTCVDYLVERSGDYKYIVLLIGTNDLYISHDNDGQTTVQEYYENMKTIINLIRANGYEAVISTLPPCNDANWQCANNDQTKIIERNNVIRKVSNELNVVYADIFMDAFGGTWTSEMFQDGVHPNLDPGKEMMGQVYANAIINNASYNCLSNPGTCYTPSTQTSVICLGDSNTAWEDDPKNYCAQMQIRNEFIEETYKHGYPGFTSFDMVQPPRLTINNVLALNEDADWVVFLVGTNDLYTGTDPNVNPTNINDYYTYMTQSVIQLKNSGRDVLLSTIPPCNTAAHQCDDNNQENVTLRNNVIRRISDEQNVAYVDIFTDVFNSQWTLEMFKWDGVHFRFLEDYEGFVCDYIADNGVLDCTPIPVADAFAAAIQNPSTYNCALNPGTCYDSAATCLFPGTEDCTTQASHDIIDAQRILGECTLTEYLACVDVFQTSYVEFVISIDTFVTGGPFQSFLTDANTWVNT